MLYTEQSIPHPNQAVARLYSYYAGHCSSCTIHENTTTINVYVIRLFTDHNMLKIYHYKFTCCFLWMWNKIIHKRTKYTYVRMPENWVMRTLGPKGVQMREAGESYTVRSFLIRLSYQIWIIRKRTIR
jgi:hypothetical protein